MFCCGSQLFGRTSTGLEKTKNKKQKTKNKKQETENKKQKTKNKINAAKMSTILLHLFVNTGKPYGGGESGHFLCVGG